MSDKISFLEAARLRRSIYPLSDKIPISDARVEELVTEAIKHVPSSFNSQSTRLVVLLNEEHQKFWEYVKEVLKPQVPEEEFPKTEGKLNMFKAAHGTILFLDDPDPVNELAKNFPLYAAHFPGWAVQSNAMHQYFLWTALEAEGLGANLQHYNPIIDQKAKTEWNIPQTWELRAQLVFGGPGNAREQLSEKTFKPIEDRVKVYGAK